uniref:Uncharacterized protein n=1 Tax=viral metagenome TaxID=1070528 RepID=A0A6H1ZNE4_9ZZZZ
MSGTIKMTNEQISKIMVTYVNTPDGPRAMPNPVTESLKKKKLPPRNQYWIRRALDKVTQNYKILEETRQGLIQQHARKDKDDKPLIIMRDFAKIKPLMDAGEIEQNNIPDIDTALKGEAVSVKTAEAIAKWSEGKVSAESNGSIALKDISEFQKAVNELMTEEVDLGINLIEVDFDVWETSFKNEKGEKVYRYDLLDGDEMDLLMPMLEVK